MTFPLQGGDGNLIDGWSRLEVIGSDGIVWLDAIVDGEPVHVRAFATRAEAEACKQRIINRASALGGRR